MSVTVDMEGVWAEFIKTKRPALREELIEAYTPLVRFTVGRMGIPSTSLMEAEDLVSYGIIGLINAIDRFDLARGASFEGFAVTRIRGAVIDQLRALNWRPRTAMTHIRQVEATMAELEQQLGRPAKEEEAVQAMGVSTERYRHMLAEVGMVIMSLDVPLGTVTEGEQPSLGEVLEDKSMPGPAEEAERREMVGLLSEAIGKLPPRERLLLALYYQEELTMKEISQVMAVSESRVCQLHTQAILRLRGALDVDVAGGAIKKQRHQKSSITDQHTRQKVRTIL